MYHKARWQMAYEEALKDGLTVRESENEANDATIDDMADMADMAMLRNQYGEQV